jgi:hypothetical protein
MTLDVSSWFIAQSRREQTAPVRRFTLGGSDYSQRVLRWPVVRFRTDTIDLGTTQVVLSNIARDFQFLVDSGTALTDSCELSLGFTHPESGEERLSLFVGAPSHLGFTRDGRELRLQMQGKTKRLTDTALGTDTQSGGIDFTGSAHLPADLAWTLVTCYGGMADVRSVSNPDIHYAEWEAWRDENVVRDLRVKAYLRGERIFQVLNALAVMDARTITFRNTRLRFGGKYQPFGSVNPELPGDHVLELRVTLDPARITNHFFVEAGYDPGTGVFLAQLTRVNTASMEIFGQRSARFSSRGVWFATGNDGRYLAEDQVRFGRRPRPAVTVRTPLARGLEYSAGEVITLTHSHFGWTQRPFRVVEQAIDLDDGSVALQLEAAEHRPWQFQASVSSSNLAVGALVAVGSDHFLAMADAGVARPVFRSEGGGAFLPTGIHATAMHALSGQELLFGGPPSSGFSQAVIQRSSDCGSTTTVVSSLASNVSQVVAFFRVDSATLLASANSGAIFRSTDAGSSWYLTDTISGAYRVSRFCQPRSGTLWGGTGYDHPVLAEGLHLWESQDGGQSWLPRHTVHSSGDYVTAGFHYLTDSECLLAHYGSTILALGVQRSLVSAPESVAWTTVLSGAAFAEVVPLGSGGLLFGFEEELTLGGGILYRSLDQGSSWNEDARIVKQGNIRLIDNGDGTLEGFVSHMTVGERTDRYRNYDPDETP